MYISIDYIVMSTDPRPHQSDHGSWTHHDDLDDAKALYDRLAKHSAYGLYIFKRTKKDDKIKMKSVWPKG